MIISAQNISQILHGPKFILPANTTEIEFRVEGMKKVKFKQIGSKEKLVQFWWMVGIIVTDQEESPWVFGGVGGIINQER